MKLAMLISKLQQIQRGNMRKEVMIEDDAGLIGSLAGISIVRYGDADVIRLSVMKNEEDI